MESALTKSPPDPPDLQTGFGTEPGPHDLPFGAMYPGLKAPDYGAGCFICHRTFDAAVLRTDEDVIPKWMLKRLNLGNAKAGMPNGQLVRYGQRKVPCCWDCNQRMSTSLELPVSRAFAEGCDAVRGLDPTVLFLWLAKVYFGTRFVETGRRQDVSDRASPLMLEPNELRASTSYLRRCLQHRPDQLTFTSKSASTFIFRAGVPAHSQDRFDFLVPTIPPADMVAIRFNDVFVIGIFGDGGHWARELGAMRIVAEAMTQLRLHPMQCDELALWFAAESGGSHTSEGTYDLLTTQRTGCAVTSVMDTRFRVRPTGAPRSVVNLMRVESLLNRVGADLGPEDRVRVAAADNPPTTLVNVATGQLVQATCLERTCTAVFARAGWNVGHRMCATCAQ